MLINHIETWVQAWFSSFVWDDESYRISIENYLIERPKTTISVRIKWESMIEVWIMPNDIALVDTSLVANSWNIVIAIIDWKYTIKFLEKDIKWKFYLKGANKDLKHMYPENDLVIFGVVVGIIRKYI